MKTLTVHAPFGGWLLDLAGVPDEAFASGMVGQGVAIDPTDMEVRAPFDGVVAGLPDTRHAVTVRSADGVEVLIHVGLDTVALAGSGFAAHVAPGDTVRTGDLLLTLDLDRIADGARSLVSPVVAISGIGEVEALRTGRAVTAGEPILRVAAGARSEAVTGGPVLEREVRPALPLGLHARPAARIAACVKAFDAQVTLVHGAREANAASLVAMMGLGVRDGDALRLVATGPQAAEALMALEALMANGLEGPGAAPATAMTAPPPTPLRSEDGELILGGVAAAPGLVIGRAVRLKLSTLDAPEDGEGVSGNMKRWIAPSPLSGPD